jgi:hypothetical protein
MPDISPKGRVLAALFLCLKEMPMIRGFRLREPLRADASVNLDDALDAKKALRRLGDFETPEYGLTPYPDRPLFDAVRRFQRREGLVEDGIMNPGGPTEAALSRKLAALNTGQGNAAPNALRASQESERRRYGSKTPPAGARTPLLDGSVQRQPSPKKKGEATRTAAAVAIPLLIPETLELLGALGAFLFGRELTDGDEDPKRAECWRQHEEDAMICREIGEKYGSHRAQRCWSSLYERYSSCLAGRPIPALDTGGN